MVTKVLTAPTSVKFNREQRLELADFLRTRRARLSPQQFGLPTVTRRKVPGLRREEVAELAGIGTTWYTWLEQCREVNVSVKTLQRLADALRLAPEERRYMFVLAGQQSPVIDSEKDQMTLDGLRGILRGLDPNPAYILNDCWDFVAWNRSAIKVFGRFQDRPEGERNLVWLLFTDPYLRKLHDDWDSFAYCILTGLRGEIVSTPIKARLAEMTHALRHVSNEFNKWWSTHNILLPQPKFRILRHPKAGKLTFHLTVLQVFRAPHLKLFSFTPVAGTDTEDRLASMFP